MGQEAGEKWAVAVVSQPTMPKSDRLLEHFIRKVGGGHERIDLWRGRLVDVLAGLAWENHFSPSLPRRTLPGRRAGTVAVG